MNFPLAVLLVRLINGGRLTSSLSPTTAFNPRLQYHTPCPIPLTTLSLSLNIAHFAPIEKKKISMAKETSARFAAAVLCFAVVGVIAAGGAATIAEKCAGEFQKVTQCLTFVTAKAAAPSKDCCDSVTELKDSDPACLCYIIQQVHNGSNAAVKSMGVQESRLLQLPSACKLANASVAECPSNLLIYPSLSLSPLFWNFRVLIVRSMV